MALNRTFLILSAFLASVSLVQAAPAPACPFTKTNLDCQCVQGQSPNVFQSVTCQVSDTDTLPKFDSTQGQYSITGDLFIQFQTPRAFYIDAKSFVDFSSIGQLRLESYNGATSISWDETALAGTKIAKFLANNIYHFNSAFAALHQDSGYLQKLELDSGGAYHLGADDLKDFKHLQSLMISDTEISTIDQAAFSGLENVIQELTLLDANIDERIFPALQGLKVLNYLNVSGNEFKTFDLSAMEGMSSLVTLAFDSSDSLGPNLTLSDLSKVRTLKYAPVEK